MTGLQTLSVFDPPEHDRLGARRFLVACLLALIPGISSAVEKPPASWKTECVGRMQIGLPEEVEVAAMLPKDFALKLAGKKDSPYKFQDGQNASWSLSGYATITHPGTMEEKQRVDGEIERHWKRATDYYKARRDETGESFVIAELPRTDFVKLAWHGNNYYQAYFDVNNVIVDWGVSVGADDLEGMQRIGGRYHAFAIGIRPRSTFERPKEPGLCLPYLFVQDDGTSPRHVGNTYRLKDHPDITVWLQDATAAIVGPRRNPDHFTAHYMAGFFWEQDYQNRQSFASLWPGHKAFKPGTLAGYKGVKTFVELFRHDGTRDLGYLVAVRGDPEAKEDNPDLMLYVIQDSLHARRRGIEPLAQEAFFQLAETVAASVKRREINLER